LPPVIEAFLAAGPPPVFLGFGSMPMPALKATAAMAIAAARANGVRLLLSAGWAGLELEDAGDDWLAIGEVNQQALFPRLAAVVHHGGAGTTHTAARAGAPQVVVPQVADQPYYGSRVTALGVGTAHEGGVPTEASLSAALKVVLAPEVALRARALAGRIKTDGAAGAAGLLLQAAA
jgi:vancomycin aglycone glucosyltransferase